MKNSTIICLFFLLTFNLLSCKKNDSEKEGEKSEEIRIHNNIKVEVAINAINEIRKNGRTGYPSVAAVVWSDQISDILYEFATEKAKETNPNTNPYLLQSGRSLPEFFLAKAATNGYFYGFCYIYPVNTDIEKMIKETNEKSEDSIVRSFMSDKAKKIGMAQLGGRWYIIFTG